ncbi:hypothetical protein [Flavisericum labens]|uniref:hypothetical protein n=1 Tax=Flavisericum labens TaxID=3377112 RepID=UPI00387B7BC5
MKSVFLIMFILFFVACDDIIEVEDISKQSVDILAPTDNSTVDTVKVAFSWSPVSDAEQYHLQVAKPSFENASQIVADTLLTRQSYSQDLVEGNYQWRIRAENSGYATPYTTVSFSIAE